MLAYLNAAIAFLDGHPSIAYGLVFLAAVLEAMPLIGAIVPGSTIIIAISALAPSGAVTFWPLLFWAVLGAVIGDAASYQLGSRYQRQILERWPFSRYPQLAARSEAFFRRHGGKSVAFGRFTPALRPFVPLFAGILGMPAGRFYLANILSALLWAPAHIIPGIALGATLGLAAAVAGRLVALALIVLLLVWAVTWAARYALRRGLPYLAALRRSLLAWAGQRKTWLARQVLSILDPTSNEIPGLAAATVTLIAAAWLFLGILEDVVTGDPLVRADVAVRALLQSLRSPLGDAIMVAITELGDVSVVVPMVIVVALWFLIRRAPRTAAYWVAAVAVASIFNSLVKVALSRPRPLDELYTGVAYFSFPSGHTTVNTALYGFIGFLIARGLRPARSMPIVAVLACFVVLIAFSRLYLGAHWFSDVASGMAFGVAWITLLGTAYHYHRPERILPRGLLLVVGLTLVLAGGINVYRKHASDIGGYAIRAQSVSVSVSDWQGGAWRNLPAQRTDLVGEDEGPLTIQWAGKLETLDRLLQDKGWRAPQPLTMGGALAWISPDADPRQIPTLPLLHEGLAPSLTLILPRAGDSRLVLRLWPTNTLVGADPVKMQPIWLGSVIEERLERSVWPFTIGLTQRDRNGPRDQIGGSIGGGRLEARPDVTASPSWDGRVLLIQAPDL